MTRQTSRTYHGVDVAFCTLLARSLVMNPKPRPNHKAYLKTLRAMTAGQRLQKAFELSELGKAVFLEGLRKRFPDVTKEQLHQNFLDRLEKCHNRNY
jgi:hypothetical protein